MKEDRQIRKYQGKQNDRAGGGEVRRKAKCEKKKNEKTVKKKASKIQKR